MPPLPQWYDSTDTTLESVAIAVSSDSGTEIGPTINHLWNDKGGGTAGTLRGYLQASAMVSGQWVTSGTPILDECWFRARITGKDSTGDATMTDQTTGYTPVGANNPLVLQPIPANCARFIEWKIEIPAAAVELSQAFQLELVVDGVSIPLAYFGGFATGSGIAADVLDSSLRRVTRGRRITASGAASVVVGAGSYVYDGSLATVIDTTVTLNQTAADGALASGQSYIARLSQKSDRTVTTTKSNKSGSPTAPAVPTDEINLGTVHVSYQAGGTSVIVTADVDMSSVVYGECAVTAGTGLTVIVSAGTGIASTSFASIADSQQSVSVADNTTNYVWLLADGTKSSTTTAALPSPGANLLATAVTSAGAVTSVTDMRSMRYRAVDTFAIVLRKSVPSATATDFDFGILPFDAVLDSVDLDIMNVGTSASGSFKVDVLSRAPGVPLGTTGTSVYTSSGTQDLRASIAYNSSSPRSADNRGHEVTTFVRGTRFSASLVAVPATITVNPSDLFVTLNFRRT